MKVFVTVGSTSFPELIERVLEITRNVDAHYEFIIQYGSVKPKIPNPCPSNLVTFDYQSDLTDYYSSSDIVISHAGAGSLLEALKWKRRIIAVPNQSLMENHQLELAVKMESLGYIQICELKDLETTLKSDCKLKVPKMNQRLDLVAMLDKLFGTS